MLITGRTVRFSPNLLDHPEIFARISTKSSKSFSGILGNLPGFDRIRENDGSAAEVVVDALGEKSLGRGFTERGENGLGALAGESGFCKCQESITIGMC